MKTFLIENKIIVAIAAAVLILGALILGTNDSDSDNKPETKPAVVKTTEPTAEPELDTETREQMFLDVVYDEYPILALDGDDAGMIAGGYRICDDIGAGATIEDFVADAEADGIDPGMYGYVVGVAVTALCPEHEDWLADNSESGDTA